MKATDRQKTETSILARWGWRVTVVAAAAFWIGLLVIGVLTLSACATVPPARWEAISVAGTGHVQVWQDGRPRMPGLYRIVATEPGKADFFRGDQYVGTGTVSVVEPTDGNVKIEVAPGARVVISPGS